MKKVLFLVLVLALTIGGFVGNDVQAEDLTTLTWVLPEDIEYMDPPFSFGVYDQIFITSIHEPLMWAWDGTTGEADMRGVLAEDWEALDDYTWRIWLKDDVYFHNGEHMTAEDVQYSIERTQHENFPSTDKFVDVPINRVEIVDEYTVDIITDEPVPIMPARLSRNGAFIVEKGHYGDYTAEDYDDKLEELARNPVGTGPYKLVDFEPGERAILEAHEDYHDWPEDHNVDRLVFEIIPETSTQIAELMTQQVDIIPLHADMVSVVEEQPGIEAVIRESLARAMIGFNLEAHEALEDKRVRQALNYAIDRETLIDVFAFGDEEAAQLINVVQPPNHHPDLEPYPYDPEKAQELMEEAGYPDGFEVDTLDVMVPESYEYSEVIASMWRDAGVLDIGEVRELEWAVAHERWADRSLSIHSFLWMAAENTPVTDIYAVSDQRQTNSTNWYHEEFEELYEELTVTVDEERFQEINYKLQEILHEEAPWAWLYRDPLVYGVTERVTRFNPHPSGSAMDWRAISIEE